MQIIALINQKGGVGKTTCTINIGAGLNKLRKRVLLGIPTARGGISGMVGPLNICWKTLSIRALLIKR